ncbi:hypothetical protein VTJ83DRAFT_7005 [Remersonia thermophila]|uniref:Uncharacterized protein n=1 Tax=Remersonia thermophila TaxID=72144 RepID=A0ABR4D390_9PEZI
MAPASMQRERKDNYPGTPTTRCKFKFKYRRLLTQTYADAPKIDLTISPDRQRSSEACEGTKQTYTVCCLATALQPDSRTGGDRPGREPDAVIPTHFDHPRRAGFSLARLYNPPVVPRALGLRRGQLGEEVPSALEHIHVGLALVASGADDNVGFEHLFSEQRPISSSGSGDHSNLQADLVALILDGQNLAPGENPVRPLCFVRSQGPLLVIHDLKEVLDELKADDTVVGRLGISDQVGSIGRRLGIEVVDKLRVEDAVDAG